MTGTTTATAAREVPTAAQKIVATMWRLGAPATAKDIAAAAGVGYSTSSLILRNLLATGQAVKTNTDDGTTLWHLTATLPGTTPPAPTMQEVPDTVGGGTPANDNRPDAGDPNPTTTIGSDLPVPPDGAPSGDVELTPVTAQVAPTPEDVDVSAVAADLL